MTSVPLLRGNVVNEYGKTQAITIKNFSGVVQNVSSYTGTKNAIFRSPDSKKTIVCTATFLTDGSDGVVVWSFSSSALLDREGTWNGQIELRKTNNLMKSYYFDLEVGKELR